MATDQIFDSIRKIAPNVAFSVSAESDLDFVWDGDGPDPTEDGYLAHDMDVKALAIIDGRQLEGHSYLGGHYLKYGESDPEIGGYLLQMLQEAAEELRDQVCEDSVLKAQCDAVYHLLEDEMRRSYDEQRKTATV